MQALPNILYNMLHGLEKVVANKKSEYTNIRKWISILLPYIHGSTPGSSILSAPEVSDLPEIIRLVAEAVLNAHPYITVFLEHALDGLEDHQVLQAIDSCLGNLPFIDVCIKEKLHVEDWMDVPETCCLKEELRKVSLQQIWEERLCERYGCDHVNLKLKRGSTLGEYHLPLSMVVMNVASISNPILKVQVELPAALSMLFNKSMETALDNKIIKSVAKSALAVEYNYRARSKKMLIAEFGVGGTVAEEVLPHNYEMFQYFTVTQHLDKYVQEHAEWLGVNDFLDAMQIHNDSWVWKDMHEFFTICPDVMTPAAWFMGKVESRFTHVCGVLPEDWASGRVFMTQVNPPSDPDICLHPIQGIFWNTNQSPSRGAVLTTLKIDPKKDAGPYMFHANTLENAKDIVGDQGINPSKGRKNCDFGHSGSFYLTDDFAHAVEWADKHHGTGLCAVIIYKVSQIPPTIPGIDLSASDLATQTRWKNLVLHSRQNKLHQEVRLTDQADWVYGLEASFSVERDLHDPNWDPAPRTHQQLAIKSYTTAFLFNTMTVGIIIFPPFRK